MDSINSSVFALKSSNSVTENVDSDSYNVSGVGDSYFSEKMILLIFFY